MSSPLPSFRPSSIILALVIGALGGVASCAMELGDDEHDHEGESALFEQAFEEEADEGKADGPGCSGVHVPDRGGFGKRVALTFDDGPSPATTPAVLATLRRHGVPATFFINGSRMGTEAARAIARDIASDPSFILANHTQNHRNDLTRVSRSVLDAQIDQTTEHIRGSGETPRYFRFPFGASTCNTARVVRDRGYVITGWHIDSADWCYARNDGYCSPSTFRHVPSNVRRDMRTWVMQQVRERQGGILLFHDIHAFTAGAIDGIIQQLKDEGYTFVNVDDTEVFPLLNGATPPPPSFVGTSCTTDAQCSFRSGSRSGFCAPHGFCSLPCEGTCPDLAGHAPTFCVERADVAGTGMCASKAHALNMSCASMAGTRVVHAARFVGQSASRPATADVCLP